MQRESIGYVLLICYTGIPYMWEMLNNRSSYNKCIFHNPFCASYEEGSFIWSANKKNISKLVNLKPFRIIKQSLQLLLLQPSSWNYPDHRRKISQITFKAFSILRWNGWKKLKLWNPLLFETTFIKCIIFREFKHGINTNLIIWTKL